MPWDLDGVLGIIQDGKRIATTNDILTNMLFDRLASTNAADYKALLKQRWLELRQGLYSNEALHQRIDETYQMLDNTKLYERDSLMWERSKTTTDDYEYMTNWLEKRLIYLDTTFKAY